KIGVSVRHIFKPISYLEIQLLSGVSGGYITIDHAHLVVYLFESDGGRYFSAARAPEDVAFEIGDILKHDAANIWVRSDGTKLKFEGNITCSTLQEAEARFTQQIAEIG
ncbi:hypothetical protein L8O22_22435, partial [Enterobacter roggenkampii]|uniref:hypothetical protein n=1 Tax=Enterobacter roggenkampii TaxID=1812935 RepID=UPI002004AE77